MDNSNEYTDAISGRNVLIIEEPSDIFAELDCYVTIHCSVSCENSTFQWFDKNGKPMKDKALANLTLGPINDEDFGFYRLKITDKISKQEKLTRWVEVKRRFYEQHPPAKQYAYTQPIAQSMRPVITLPPRGGVFKRGETVSLYANCENATCFQWLKDGAMLNGCTGKCITINGIQAHNIGMYSLIASNQFGIEVTTPVMVSVKDN